MQRPNIFEDTHQALRDTLYSTALRLQRMDSRVRAEAYAALVQTRRSLEQLEEHLHLEASFILDTLFEYEHGIVDTFFRQQADSKVLMEKVHSCLMEVNQSGHPAPASAWKNLVARYSELLSTSLQQMKNEEEVLSAILWCYLSNGHLTTIRQQLEKGLHERQTSSLVAKSCPRIYPKSISVPDLTNSITLKQAL